MLLELSVKIWRELDGDDTGINPAAKLPLYVSILRRVHKGNCKSKPSWTPEDVQ
jgi:hypothetical protein